MKKKLYINTSILNNKWLLRCSKVIFVYLFILTLSNWFTKSIIGDCKCYDFFIEKSKDRTWNKYWFRNYANSLLITSNIVLMHCNSSAFFMLNLCYQEHNILLLVRSLLKYFYQCTDEDHNQFWCPTVPTTVNGTYFTRDKTTNTINYTMWGNCGSDCQLEGMFWLEIPLQTKWV